MVTQWTLSEASGPAPDGYEFASAVSSEERLYVFVLGLPPTSVLPDESQRLSTRSATPDVRFRGGGHSWGSDERSLITSVFQVPDEVTAAQIELLQGEDSIWTLELLRT